MRRMLFFTAVVILCCTLLERQYSAINSYMIDNLPQSGFTINKTDEFPEDAVREPMILPSSANCLIPVRILMQRDMFFLRSDSGTNEPTLMSTALVKKTYNIKSINLVPFNLRI